MAYYTKLHFDVALVVPDIVLWQSKHASIVDQTVDTKAVDVSGRLAEGRAGRQVQRQKLDAARSW
jgi:hypothetical protein